MRSDYFPAAEAPTLRAPLWLRLLGKRDYDGSYRFSWGELAPRGLGFALELVHYDEPVLIFALLWPRLFIHLPRWAWIRCLYPHGHDLERSFGFSLKLTGEFAFDLFWHWRERCRIFHPPWGWNKRRHDYRREYLGIEGVWHSADDMPRSWAPDAKGPSPWEQRLPYHYMTDEGDAQHVTAAIRRERRRDVFRIFGIPVRLSKRDEIAIEFSEEVGSARGNWKGGCLGCGYAMKPGETPAATLRRMQRERRFR